MSAASKPLAVAVTDILDARKVVNRYLSPTPTIQPASLSAELGFNITLKCENLQPIGAFKIRGGVNLLSRLDDEVLEKGVVTASTGNHAQSIAYAAKLVGTRAVIYMPEDPNPLKAAAVRRLGGEIIEHGPDFDSCNEAAKDHADREGMRYVHPGNEPHLIAGVGTYALELIEAEPHLDTVIVPVGGGSGVCGTATVFKAMSPSTKVIAVQTANMPAVYDSFHQKKLISHSGGQTWAEGLATRVAFEMPFEMMQELVDDVVLVSENDMREAMLDLMEAAHIVAEGAGAASLAAAKNMASDLQGQNVGLIVSGGNVTLDTIRRAVCSDEPW
ncbi:threonine ammonia-lyase [soil metagenome]